MQVGFCLVIAVDLESRPELWISCGMTYIEMNVGELKEQLNQIRRGEYTLLVFRDIAENGFQTWPKDIQQFVRSEIMSIWDEVLGGSHQDSIDPHLPDVARGDGAAWLFAVAAMYIVSPRELMERWEARDDRAANRQLVKSLRELLPDNFDIHADYNPLEPHPDLPQEAELTELLLYSAKLQRILSDKQLAKSFGLIDTAVDLQRLKEARRLFREAKISS